MKKLFKKLFVLACVFIISQTVVAQNVTINGSCLTSLATLIAGGDATTPTLNGRPVYYNASVNVNYSSSPLTPDAYLYYELASNLGTPEDRWVLSYDGQPFYYFISTSLTAPIGTYLPFDPGAPIADCGGSVTVGVSIPLASSLVGFDAYLEKSYVNLQWTCNLEDDNCLFDIQRSTDGKVFQSIGEVSGMNNITRYAFNDQSPRNGKNYYRLHLKNNGRTSNFYSTVKEVFYASGSAMSFYPSPADNHLNIVVDNLNEKHSVIMSDITGKQLLQATLNDFVTVLSVAPFETGVYYLSFYTNNQRIQTATFIKK